MMIKIFLLSFLFNHMAYGADQIYPVDLSSPRQSMMTFLKNMKAFKLGNKKAIDEAIQVFNLQDFDQTSGNVSAKLQAKYLIRILDKIEYVDFNDIPQKLELPNWTFKTFNIEHDFKIQNLEISLAQSLQGQWKFSTETVRSIPILFSHFKKRENVEGVVALETWKDKIKDYMPGWMSQKSIILYNGQWVALFFLIIISFILDRLFRIYVGATIKKYLMTKEVSLNHRKERFLTLPFGIIVFSGVWILGVRFLEFSDDVLSILLRGGYIVFTVGCVFAAHHLVDVLSLYFEGLAKQSENKFDDILVPLLRKAAKVFVICVGFVFIGHSLTLNVTNLVAGLGIGGLAFALAAKDTLSNLFGSLTVILDRPFQIGDWVKIGDDVEGTVMEVGFRSTRVKTFYDSIITVPNNQLTNIHIDNMGIRQYRRYSTSLGIEYDTPAEKIEAFCEGIRQLILNHKFTRKDNFHVYFNNFSSSSLDIMLYVFWQAPDWSTELNERHRLLLDIQRLAKSLEVNFAFPTQTLHLFPQNEKKPHQIPGDFRQWATKQSQQLLQSQIAKDNPSSSLKDYKR